MARYGKNKYGAKRVRIDGHTFHSKREAERYKELKLLQEAGEIRDLELQPRFSLRGEAGDHIGYYIADFRYREGENGVEIIEDVKGYETELFKWKKRHFEADYRMRLRLT